MANTFSATVNPPDPLKFGAGQKLLADGTGRFSDLCEAFNWLHAYGGSQNVITQGWGDEIATVAAVMPGAGSTHARWRFPQIDDAFTTVRCAVYARFAGTAPATGSVRFQSTNGADSLTLTINDGAAAWYEGTLTVAFAGGYETVDMTIAGDGTDATTVYEVAVDYQPLSSPLAAAGSSNITPFDEAERDADSCVASDLGRYMLDNLTALFVRQRVYYQWSDLTGVEDGMSTVEHVVWIPVHYGGFEQTLTMTVHVEATGVASASKVYIYHSAISPGLPSDDATTTVIDVAAGAARQWYSTTFRLFEAHRLRGLPHPFIPVVIWPGTRDVDGVGGFSPRVPQNLGNPTPTIHAVSMWSV